MTFAEFKAVFDRLAAKHPSLRVAACGFDPECDGIRAIVFRGGDYFRLDADEAVFVFDTDDDPHGARVKLATLELMRFFRDADAHLPPAKTSSEPDASDGAQA